MKPQLASFQRKIAKEKGLWCLACNYRTLKWLTWSTLLLRRNVWIDLSNQRACCHMDFPKRFCHLQPKLALTSFLLEHTKCTLPTPDNPPPNLVYTKLMQMATGLAWYRKSCCAVGPSGKIWAGTPMKYTKLINPWRIGRCARDQGPLSCFGPKARFAKFTTVSSTSYPQLEIVFTERDLSHVQIAISS